MAMQWSRLVTHNTANQWGMSLHSIVINQAASKLRCDSQPKWHTFSPCFGKLSFQQSLSILIGSSTYLTCTWSDRAIEKVPNNLQVQIYLVHIRVCVFHIKQADSSNNTYTLTWSNWSAFHQCTLVRMHTHTHCTVEAEFNLANLKVKNSLILIK